MMNQLLKDLEHLLTSFLLSIRVWV